MSIYPVSFIPGRFNIKLKAFFLLSSAQIAAFVLVSSDCRGNIQLGSAAYPLVLPLVKNGAFPSQGFGFALPDEGHDVFVDVWPSRGPTVSIGFALEEEEVDAVAVREGDPYLRMLEFVYWGDLNGLRHFLEGYPGLDINHVYPNGEAGDLLFDFTLLHQAALNNDAPMVEFLLARGARAVVRKATRDGRTPLQLAQEHEDNDEMIDVLIRSGLLMSDLFIQGEVPSALIFEEDDEDEEEGIRGIETMDQPGVNEEELYAEALEYVYLGDVNDLRVFLNEHPELDINHVYAHGDEEDPLHDFTLLHQAALHHYLGMVEFLLVRGARDVLSQGDSRGRTPLHLAVVYGDDSDTVDALIRVRARLDVPDEDGVLPEHYAARGGYVRSLYRMLRESSNFRRDNQGRTFVHYAAEAGRVNVVKLWCALVNRGLITDEFPVDDAFNTPLHLAAIAGHTNMIVFFSGCIDEANRQRDFPLHLAARSGQLKFAKALVAAGAKMRVVSRRLYTPLHEAVEAEHVELVRYFIGEGVEVDTWYLRGLEFGPTAMELAVQLEHPEIISLIEQTLPEEQKSFE